MIACSFETYTASIFIVIPTYWARRCHKPEDQTLNGHSLKDLKLHDT